MTLSLVTGNTYHGRHGQIANRFRYGVDYVLADLDEQAGSGRAKTQSIPALFSFEKVNLFSLYRRDHGGQRRQGMGADWVRAVLLDQGFTHLLNGRIRLLAQPRVLGHVFNPVSFWLVYDPQDDLALVIAEVNNTFGDRHSYLCYNDDLRPITANDQLDARKIFHVSPFQEISGSYHFRFDIRKDALHIVIDFRNGQEGVLATYTGAIAPLSNRAILRSVFRRPFGSLRVLALIHWQALKLKLKGARYLSRPVPPTKEISR